MAFEKLDTAQKVTERLLGSATELRDRAELLALAAERDVDMVDESVDFLVEPPTLQGPPDRSVVASNALYWVARGDAVGRLADAVGQIRAAELTLADLEAEFTGYGDA